MQLQDSSGWHFSETNSWENIFTWWEGSIDQNIPVWSPKELFKSFNIKRSSVSISIFNHFHGWKLIDSNEALTGFSCNNWLFSFFSILSLLNVSLSFFFLFLCFFLRVFNWDVFLLDFSNEFSIITPLVSLSMLITNLIELSDSFKGHEVPNGVWVIILW